jgi:hypothetical protein
MEKFEPRSEWSAPAARLEDFVRGAAWHALPLPIKVALAHIWRSEQELAETFNDNARQGDQIPTTASSMARGGDT